LNCHIWRFWHAFLFRIKESEEVKQLVLENNFMSSQVNLFLPLSPLAKNLVKSMQVMVGIFLLEIGAIFHTLLDPELLVFRLCPLVFSLYVAGCL
jgi:hypothetical protein